MYVGSIIFKYPQAHAWDVLRARRPFSSDTPPSTLRRLPVFNFTSPRATMIIPRPAWGTPSRLYVSAHKSINTTPRRHIGMHVRSFPTGTPRSNALGAGKLWELYSDVWIQNMYELNVQQAQCTCASYIRMWIERATSLSLFGSVRLPRHLNMHLCKKCA